MSGAVIVGAGTAGAHVAAALRQRGYEGTVTLVGAERCHPYHRPPLSKVYLKDGVAASLPLRPESFWADKGIDLVSGVEVLALDRARNEVALADGRVLDYRHLILATGARPFRPPIPGVEQDGVLTLRTVEDADALRARVSAGKLVVVGGGFIGLEVAATARALGADVTIIEIAPRVMARLVSPYISRFFEHEHRRRGVEILLATSVRTVLGDGVVTGVELESGDRRAANVVAIGVGVRPEIDLAAKAGLACGPAGIAVDHRLLTSDPSISAIGDCATYPCAISRRDQRVESIQTATDHARFVAERLTGGADRYVAVPWFWSDQYDLRLQIAGIARDDDDVVLRGSPADARFSVARLSEGRLTAVESVNHVRDHLAARKLLAVAGELRLTRESIEDTSIPLKQHLPQPLSART